MLKKMMYRKIMVATSLLLIMFMLYLIPTNNNKIEMKEIVEYENLNDLSVVYLLNEYDTLSMTKMNVNKNDEIKDVINILTIDGTKSDIIPNGFKSLIPKNTKVIDIKLEDEILTINFSKEFNNIKLEQEDKVIESLIYTLTSINGINKLEIYVEGNKLTNLPNSNRLLPKYLDKDYGINKEYELTTLNDIDSYTIYYVLNYNNQSYYTPVTKYINNNSQDKVKVIIDELTSSLTYQSNLISYLDSNAKLLDYTIKDDTIKLNFNDLILSSITDNVILEEVIYTISLSLCDELDITSVIFQVNDKEISSFSTKTLD